MNESQRIQWWQNLATHNTWLQQFGQSGDSKTFNGATGCAFCVLQTLLLGWKGIRVTQDRLAYVAGYPTAYQKSRMLGLYAYQINKIISHYRLPYKVGFGWSYVTLMRRANTYGPVAFGVAYGYQPEWYGRTYGGVRADGRPNGFASPLGRAGKTQLTGFERGPHLDVLFGYHVNRYSDGSVKNRIYHVKDPNHGSAARPEKPKYDDMSQAQFKRLYESYKNVLGRSLYVIYPTAVFNR